MSISTVEQSHSPPRLSDSAWFWAYLFSTCGLLALFLMGPKYAHRQTHIEDEYLHGVRTLARPAAADAPSAGAKPAEPRDDTPLRAPLADGPQPPTHEMLISLWPLKTVAGLAMIVCCVMMQITYLRRRRASAASAATDEAQRPLPLHSP